MFHSLLTRQLKKDKLDENLAPTLEQWQEFLEKINCAYQETDQERSLLERSLIISTNEMQEINERLNRSETRFALAEQGANDGFWDWELGNEAVYYSPRWFEILGLEMVDDQKPGKDCWLDRIHPDPHFP